MLQSVPYGGPESLQTQLQLVLEYNEYLRADMGTVGVGAALGKRYG